MTRFTRKFAAAALSGSLLLAAMPAAHADVLGDISGAINGVGKKILNGASPLHPAIDGSGVVISNGGMTSEMDVHWTNDKGETVKDATLKMVTGTYTFKDETKDAGSMVSVKDGKLVINLPENAAKGEYVFSLNLTGMSGNLPIGGTVNPKVYVSELGSLMTFPVPSFLEALPATFSS